MGTRGRKSAAASEVVSTHPIQATQRPDAPYELTDEEAQEWWAIVDSLPADWFTRETYPLLAQYCKHVIASRRVSQIIRKLESEDSLSIKEYAEALKMQRHESAAIATLATKMRIAQQSTYDKSKRKNSGQQSNKPWDV
jgi:hypothetical protein